MDMDENLQNIQIERYFNGTSFPKSTSSDSRGYLNKRRINRSTSGKTPSMYNIRYPRRSLKLFQIFFGTLDKFCPHTQN